MGKKSAVVAERPLEYEEPVVEEPGPEEAETTEAVSGEEEKPEQPAPRLPAIPEATTGGVPPWLELPQGFRFPRGRQVMFMRFPSRWTDAPQNGVHLLAEDSDALLLAGKDGLWRTCVCWPLSVGDKKLALQRAMGDVNRAGDELTKQMIRAIDGKSVDRSGMPGDGDIDIWWDQVGERVRSLLNKIWIQLHVLTREETSLFFDSCIEVRSAG